MWARLQLVFVLLQVRAAKVGLVTFVFQHLKFVAESLSLLLLTPCQVIICPDTLSANLSAALAEYLLSSFEVDTDVLALVSQHFCCICLFSRTSRHLLCMLQSRSDIPSHCRQKALSRPHHHLPGQFSGRTPLVITCASLFAKLEQPCMELHHGVHIRLTPQILASVWLMQSSSI